MTTPIVVEYVWLSGRDTHHDLRSKCKTMYSDKDLKLSDLSEWNFDGSSTGQALSGADTEILIRPIRMFPHPFFTKIKAYVALCECFLPNGQPTPDNTRYIARQIFETEEGLKLKPWFGLEQEYLLYKEKRPYGWPETGTPEAQGPYYCANGPAAWGRRYAQEHYETCLAMGLKLSGMNGEVLPGQFEFQVGPCEGLECGDHVTLARWVFLRICERAEEEEMDVNFAVKPVKGDWNGSGLHTNFSTVPMRAEGGIKEIEQCISRLAKTVADDVPFYSQSNNERLTGAHETSRLDQFSHGVGTRHTSVRIPNQVAKDKRGYFEDRRPGADADPYLVTARIFSSACGLPAVELNKLIPHYRREWMPTYNPIYNGPQDKVRTRRTDDGGLRSSQSVNLS